MQTLRQKQNPLMVSLSKDVMMVRQAHHERNGELRQLCPTLSPIPHYPGAADAVVPAAPFRVGQGAEYTYYPD